MRPGRKHLWSGWWVGVARGRSQGTPTPQEGNRTATREERRRSMSRRRLGVAADRCGDEQGAAAGASHVGAERRVWPGKREHVGGW